MVAFWQCQLTEVSFEQRYSVLGGIFSEQKKQTTNTQQATVAVWNYSEKGPKR